jgi:peptidoglycan/LPS O-acetylase OafA/YrhL
VLSLIQVLIAALVGAIASLIAVWLYSRATKDASLRPVDAILISIVVGISILLYREAGNTPSLNDDPIPVVSPNDVLCPVVTYVCLGILAGFRSAIQGAHWPRVRAVLTLVSLVVNVATI